MNSRTISRSAALAVACLLLLTTTSEAARTLSQSTPPAASTAVSPTLKQVLASNSDYSVASEVLTYTGLSKALLLPGLTATVFVPTNEAFEALGYSASNVTTLPKDVLTTILAFHVVPDVSANTTVLAGAHEFSTLLAGPNVLIISHEEDYEGPVTFVMGELNEATIVAPNLVTGKLTAHGIDMVLIPVIEEELFY